MAGKTTKIVTRETHTPLRDLGAFVLLAAAVFVVLSLISYDPSDPSWNTQSVGKPAFINNYGGIFGSYLSDLFMQLFGLASYLIPLAGLGMVWALAFTAPSQGLFPRFVGFSVMLLAVSLFLTLAAGNQDRLPAWGGACGHILETLTGAYLGTMGAILLGTTAFLMSLVLAFGLSFRGTLRKLWWLSRQIWPLALRLFHQARAGMDQINRLWAKRGTIIRSDLAGQKKETEPKIPAIASRPSPKPAVGPEIKVKRPEPAAPLPAFHTMDADAADEKKPVKPRTPSTFKLPDPSLLQMPEAEEISIDRDELLRNANTLEKKLKDFGVFGKVVEVQPGPVVTMYEFEPAPGVKVHQVTRLNDDLALALKAESVRITLLPGKAVIGIEVANRKRQVVYFREIVEDAVFKGSHSLLSLALGKDISGTPFVSDLRKMPHLLVAGATGSGKSVSVNSMILSVLFKATPDEVRLILVDPKMLELSFYEDIPHLLLPVVTDPRKASAALRWAVAEMERRYRLMADLGVRNIDGYNKKLPKFLSDGGQRSRPTENGTEGKQPQVEEHTTNLPYILIVIDELADLMMVSSREVEESIIRLAQMARASGIHLLLATQRPSVDVITGVIKANMPARVSFQVSSKIDSRTILDANGAELLLGAGDMLFLRPGTSKLVRVHGAFVTDNEVKKVTDFWKAQAAPAYDENILKYRGEQEAGVAGGDDEEDGMYFQALELVKMNRVASISMIQRKLRIGYNRAARIVERMETEGFLAPGEVGKPREVLMSRFS